VAERVFFTHGFTDTTMQTIAAEAGASKETLYRHFGSKEGLFSEIMEKRANRFLDGLDENPRQPGTLASMLRDLGIRLVETMTGRESMCLARVVFAEAPRNPDLGRIFYEQGPERLLKRLAYLLARAHERDEIHCPDPTLAASIFLGAMVTQYHIMGLAVPERLVVDPTHVRAHADEVVAMFLARYKA